MEKRDEILDVAYMRWRLGLIERVERREERVKTRLSRESRSSYFLIVISKHTESLSGDLVCWVDDCSQDQ